MSIALCSESFEFLEIVKERINFDGNKINSCKRYLLLSSTVLYQSHVKSISIQISQKQKTTELTASKMRLSLKNDQLKLYEVGMEGDSFSTVVDMFAAHEAVQNITNQKALAPVVNVENTMKTIACAVSLFRATYTAAGGSNVVPINLKLHSRHQSFPGYCVQQVLSKDVWMLWNTTLRSGRLVI